MRRIGLISDIHGNLPAFRSVLDALREAHVDTLICCGDVIGVGSSPGACTRLARSHVDHGVKGNHEYALLRGSDDAALASASAELSEEDLRYYEGLPEIATFKEFAVVHASFRAPMMEYILDRETAQASFALFDQWIGFHGHTHIPAVFMLSGCEVRSLDLTSGQAVRLHRSMRYLINPGSVGMPRNGSCGASYALLDLESETLTLDEVSHDGDLALSGASLRQARGGRR